MNPLTIAITIGLTALCLVGGFILIIIATNIWGPLGIIILAGEIYLGIRYLKRRKANK